MNMNEIIKTLAWFWEQFIYYFNLIFGYILYYYEQYKFLVLILVIIAIFVILAKVIILVKDTANVYKEFALWIWKIIKTIFLFIWKIIKLPFKLIHYLFSTRHKRRWRKEMKNSIYNVIPVDYKIPFWYWITRRKIRKQANNRLHWIQECIYTEEYIKNSCGYITMLEGCIGGGKTTFCNAYSHVRVPIYQEMIDEDLSSIELKLHELDFSFIRRIIEARYNFGETELDIFNYIIAIPEFKNSFKGVYDDYVSETPKESLLKKYITAYISSLRKNYTMCNYHLFNRITGNYNYELDPDLFNIKDPEVIKKFYIPSYVTIIDDEKALSDFKNTEAPKELDKLGTDIAMRLLRQLREETIFYISSTQNTSRIALLLRELANTYISIQSFSIVGTQNALANIYRKKQLKLERKMYRYAKRHFKKDEYSYNKFLLNNNKFKEQINYWYLKERELYASAFVKYKVLVSKKLSDLTPEKATQYEWTFPLTWTFGVYRKCEYSDFYEFLNNMSDVKSDHQLKVISSLYESSDEKYQAMIKQKTKDKKDSKEITTKKKTVSKKDSKELTTPKED